MAKTINLGIFASGNIQKATLSLLSDLGIEMEVRSEQQIPIPAIVAASFGETPKAVQNICNKIAESYLAGIISDKTFTGENDAVSFEEACENADKYEQMMVFAVDFKKNEKITRTEMATLTRSLNRASKACPVVLVCRYAEEEETRFALSLCERTAYKQSGHTGEKAGRVSILRGINPEDPHRGHMDILKGMECSDCATFDALYKHWFDAFNTKTLTDRFYKELYNWYMWVVNDSNTHFPENSHLPDHENEKKNVKIIRLITRLLFVWFIKEKKVKTRGGLPDIGLVPDILFDTKELEKVLNDFDPNSATDGEYYNAILQNLFFATLNNEVKSRKFIDTSNFYRSKKGYTVKNLYRDNKGEGKSWFKISHDEVINLFKTVPFLNCGLFECLDKYKRTDISYDVDRFFDGFSTKSGDKYRACLPNRLFFASELPEITIEVTEKGKKVPIKIKSKGLINLLNEYVFTVEENTPLEQQVSLDPELLGKVFENLLAAYNPETEESARKSSGSYYTPREIVEYMVNESLIQYLKTKLDADDETETQLRNLVSPSNLDFNFSDNQQNTILEALYHCRILDPACGSGAFPMGILQQMVHIISRLDEHNEKWEKLITQKATDETTKAFENKELTDEERKTVIAEITNTFTNNKNNPDYTRKLYLIQNCIFGVDIQPIAMMISKLRFFISLICEQDENAINFNDKDNNFGIHTLPNLETKFVAANSLLTPDVRKYTGDWTNDKQLDKLKDELMELRYRHVTARSMRDKMKIRTLDDEKRQEINEYILSTQAHADPVKISMYQDQIAHLMLERKLYEGENIVEEYVDTQADLFAETTRELVRKDINRVKSDEIDRQIHICQAQIEHEKAKENISGFAAAVKQLTEWNPYDQVKSSPFFDPDWMFGITDGFDVIIGNPPYVQKKKEEYPMYKWNNDLYKMFFEAGVNSYSKEASIICYITPKFYMINQEDEDMRVYFMENTHLIFLSFCNPFDVVTENVITLIRNEKKSIFFVPVFRENKELKEFEEEEALDLCYSCTNKYKEWVTGLDTNTLAILAKMNNKTKLINISMSKRGAEISKKEMRNTGQGMASLIGNDVTRYLIRWNNTYIDKSHKEYKRLRSFFSKDLILLRRVNTCLEASIGESEFGFNKNLYGIKVDESKGYNKYFILALINSKALNYYYKKKFSTKKEDVFPEIQTYLYEELPIPNVDEKKQQSIVSLVDTILSIKKEAPQANTDQLEEEIDERICALFGLTYEEVMIVDKNFRFKKEAYEKLLAEK